MRLELRKNRLTELPAGFSALIRLRVCACACACAPVHVLNKRSEVGYFFDCVVVCLFAYAYSFLSYA